MSDADNQAVAAQNAEAATANPTSDAAGNASASTAAAGPITGGSEGAVTLNAGTDAALTSTSSPQMFIGDGVDQVAVQKSHVIAQLKATPATETDDDKHLKDVIEMYLAAADTRFKHLLTGMENSTAAMLKHLGDAFIHLSDHIEQQDAIAAKEEANV